MSFWPIISVSFVLSAALATGQVSPNFDAASLKRSDSQTSAIGGFVGFRSTGRVTLRNVTLRDLICLAYDVPRYKVAGGPNWVEVARYDLEAKPPMPVGAAEAGKMLQNLLAERFKLRVHNEERTAFTYRLAIADRSKIHISTNTSEGSFRRMGGGELKGDAISMSRLARTLEGIIGAPVLDDTHLMGLYDFDLRWADEMAVDDSGVPLRRSDDLAPDEPRGVSLFTALRSEAGLKLSPGKGKITMTIIDQATRIPDTN